MKLALDWILDGHSYQLAGEILKNKEPPKSRKVIIFTIFVLGSVENNYLSS